jgi:hypothetical protein
MPIRAAEPNAGPTMPRAPSWDADSEAALMQ